MPSFSSREDAGNASRNEAVAADKSKRALSSANECCPRYEHGSIHMQSFGVVGKATNAIDFGLGSNCNLFSDTRRHTLTAAPNLRLWSLEMSKRSSAQVIIMILYYRRKAAERLQYWPSTAPGGWP